MYILVSIVWKMHSEVGLVANQGTDYNIAQCQHHQRHKDGNATTCKRKPSYNSNPVETHQQQRHLSLKPIRPPIPPKTTPRAHIKLQGTNTVVNTLNSRPLPKPQNKKTKLRFLRHCKARPLSPYHPALSLPPRPTHTNHHAPPPPPATNHIINHPNSSATSHNPHDAKRERVWPGIEPGTSRKLF